VLNVVRSPATPVLRGLLIGAEIFSPRRSARNFQDFGATRAFPDLYGVALEVIADTAINDPLPAGTSRAGHGSCPRSVSRS
jgi:hypothetical protein